MREFFELHFDKLLLTALLVSDRIMLLVVDKEPLIKILDNADAIVLGALIGLITGKMGSKQ